MIEKSFPYSNKIHNYSSISNKPFDVTTVSPVTTLSYFPDLFRFGNRPRRLWLM